MPKPDMEKYRALLTDSALTSEEKDELILSVWNIVGVFVDRAWGIENAPHIAKYPEKTKKKNLQKRQQKRNGASGIEPSNLLKNIDI